MTNTKEMDIGEPAALAQKSPCEGNRRPDLALLCITSRPSFSEGLGSGGVLRGRHGMQSPETGPACPRYLLRGNHLLFSLPSGFLDAETSFATK